MTLNFFMWSPRVRRHLSTTFYSVYFSHHIYTITRYIHFCDFLEHHFNITQLNVLQTQSLVFFYHLIYKLYLEDIFTSLNWLTLLWLVPSHKHVPDCPYEAIAGRLQSTIRKWKRKQDILDLLFVVIICKIAPDLKW